MVLSVAKVMSEEMQWHLNISRSLLHMLLGPSINDISRTSELSIS